MVTYISKTISLAAEANAFPGARSSNPAVQNNLVDTTLSAGSKRVSDGVVDISGRAALLSRIFGQDESTYTGKVKTDKSNTSGALVPYLTSEDRAMLEKMYEYSSANGIDLRHVDALGTDLAIYRRFGASVAPTNLYDVEGHALTVELSAVNKSAAERIAKSGAIASTTIDQGFLGSELTVGGHAVNHEFLERMVEIFSTNILSTTSVTSANHGSIAAYSSEANKLVNIASTDVQLVIPEAEYVNINGVGHWRTLELEAQHNLRISKMAAGSAVSNILVGGDSSVLDFLTLLEGYAKTKNVEQNNMNQLIELLKSSSANEIWSTLTTNINSNAEKL
jgi:hypothetical protein